MCIHHRKVMRHWKPDERRLTCAFANAGWLRAAASERPAVPSQPCQLLRLAEATIPAQPLAPWPLSPEAADSRHKRNRPQQMGPLTLAGPSEHCVLVTCHLLLFSGLTTLQDSAFGFVWDTKGRRRKKGEEKLTRCLFTQAQIFWKSRHHEKNQIMRQQKQSNPPDKKRSCTPTAPLTTLPLRKQAGPLGGDKTKRLYIQKLMQRKCTYKRPFAILQNGRRNAFTEKWGPAILSWRGKDKAGGKK